jgi:disulfide oxidoreductase YuzD
VRALMAQAYGDEVEVSYFDVNWPDPPLEVQKVMAQVMERGLTYPVVAIDGEVRLHGGVEYWQIAYMVGARR